MEKRWEGHLSSARLSTPSKGQKTLLHKSIAKYGEENFSIEIIDDSAETIEELISLEKKYIKELNSFYLEGHGYNMTLGGDGVESYNRIPIIKVDIESAEIVKEYDSITLAIEDNKRGVGEVAKDLHNNRVSNGHCFYKKDLVKDWTKEDFRKNLLERYNLVCQLDLDGNLIRYWHGVSRASNELNISQGNISSVLTGVRNQAGGFQWCYYNSLDKKINQKVKENKTTAKPIDRLDEKGNIIDTWESTLHAERELGISGACITRVCRGQRKTTAGYRWQYHLKAHRDEVEK